MTLFARPGSTGALMSYESRYDNFIGGEWVAPASGQYFENLTPVTGQPKPVAPQANPSANWDRVPGAPAPAAGNWDQSQWDPTLPAIPSAFVSGDPIAIINSILGISSTSAQVSMVVRLRTPDATYPTRGASGSSPSLAES